MTNDITQATERLLMNAIGNTISAKMHKQANSETPNSISNEEREADAPVSDKLKHTGEGFEQAGMGEYGKSQSTILGEQQTGMPTADSGVKADTSTAESKLNKDFPNIASVTDVTESAAEPTESVKDYEASGAEDSVNERLQLKKDAAALIAQTRELTSAGQKIVDYLMSQTVNKNASASAQPFVPADDIVKATAKTAAADSAAEVKTAIADMVDHSFYAAHLVAAELNEIAKLAAAKKAAESEADPTKEEPESEEVEPVGPAAPEEGIDPAAVAAMNEPDAGEDGIPSDDITELLAQALIENGIDPDALAESLAGQSGGETSPEFDADGLNQLLLDQAGQGYSKDEIGSAMNDIKGEAQAGISPAEGALADEEAAKTGQYKFASYINRPDNKTAEQERRTALLRKSIRDFIYGPNVQDFN